MYIKHHHNTYCHKQQCNSKDRIDLANNLIDRQQSSKDVVSKNHYNPESSVQ